MKLILFIISLLSIEALSAQQSLTAEFVIGVPHEEVTIEVIQRPGQIAANLKTAHESEYMIIDLGQKKMIEVSHHFKEAREFTWTNEVNSGINQLSMSLLSKRLEHYRITDEEKVLFGKTCRGVEFLEENVGVIGRGWVMLGVYLELSESIGWMRTVEGTIVEVDFGSTSTTLKKIEFTAAPEKFSTVIPEGYTFLKVQQEIEEPEVPGR